MPMQGREQTCGGCKSPGDGRLASYKTLLWPVGKIDGTRLDATLGGTRKVALAGALRGAALEDSLMEATDANRGRFESCHWPPIYVGGEWNATGTTSRQSLVVRAQNWAAVEAGSSPAIGTNFSLNTVKRKLSNTRYE